MNKEIHLNKEQLLAARFVNGAMLVVAGPGSGKTFLLVERICHMIKEGVKPDNILVITFSKKSALEMERRYKSRIDSSNTSVTFGTFHAVFFNILKYHKVYGSDGIMPLKMKYELLETVGIKLNIPKSAEKNWQNDMLEKISFYKNCEDYKYFKDYFKMSDEEENEFLSTYSLYVKLCKQNGLLDFDDMVVECKKYLENNASALKFWQEKFRYIMIDEFQDINGLQYEVIKLLAGKNRNVFCVGDDDQSIYGFRGASPSVIKRFLLDYPECEQVILKVNYRSCYQIIKAADTCIKNNSDRLNRPMQQALKHRNPGKVSVHCFENVELESDFVAKEVLKYDLSDVAIIYRSGHSVSDIESKIREYGIKYVKKQTDKSFYELTVVSVFISYLRIATGFGNKDDFLNVINHPQRNISRELFKSSSTNYFGILESFYADYPKQSKHIQKWKRDNEMIRQLPPIAAFVYIAKGMGIKEEMSNYYKSDNIYPGSFEEIIGCLRTNMEKFSSIEGFLKEVDKDISTKRNIENNNMKNNDECAVTFITAHSSKGLEYPVVFVVGLQEGLFPHHKNLSGLGLMEERRLFYVAMTRAKERLYLCGSGSKHGKRLSRFLGETGIIPD